MLVKTVLRIVVRDERGNSSSSRATINCGRSALFLGMTHTAVAELRGMCKPLRNEKRHKNLRLLLSLCFTVSSLHNLKPLTTFEYSTA